MLRTSEGVWSARAWVSGAAALRARLSLVAAALVASMALAAACSGDDEREPSPKEDSGVDTGSVAAGICPVNTPTAGEACPLPEGTTCAVGLCGSPIVE